MSAPEETRCARGRFLLASVLGLALTAAVFLPGIGDEFTWDDHGLIRTNAHIQQAEHHLEALTSHFWNISAPAAEENEVYSHLYRPIVTLAYIAQYRLFGGDATGYRALSLALHLLCCCLLFLWLRSRLPRGASRHGGAALALGLGLFALHPSRAEAVAWISGSTELWWGLFFLAASLSLERRRRWTAGALLALALLSKETAIVGAPLLLLDRWLRDKEVDRGDILSLSLPVLGALALRTLVVGFGPDDLGWDGAPSRMLASAGLYVQQVIAPLNPTAFRGLRLQSCEGGSPLALDWLLMGGGALLSLGLLSLGARRRPAWRGALADALFFVLPLLPVMNLFDLGSRNLTADRFLYIPMMGCAALLARGVLWLERRRLPLARVLEGSLALLLVGFATVTSIHCTTFASSSTLWEYELARHPDNPLALHSVGSAHLRAGLHRSGLAHLERAHELSVARCVREDRVRALADLGWAMALMTSSDETQTLLRLEGAYDDLLEAHAFAPDPSRGLLLLDLSEDEVAAWTSLPSRYAHPRALVMARLGKVEAAIAFLDAERNAGRQDASTIELRARLLAARGELEAPRASAPYVTSGEGARLRVILDALHDTLAEVPPEDRARVARFAMGFGPSSPTVQTLAPGVKAEALALRAATSPGADALRSSRDEGLARILAADAARRALDAPVGRPQRSQESDAAW